MRLYGRHGDAERGWFGEWAAEVVVVGHSGGEEGGLNGDSGGRVRLHNREEEEGFFFS